MNEGAFSPGAIQEIMAELCKNFPVEGEPQTEDEIKQLIAHNYAILMGLPPDRVKVKGEDGRYEILVRREGTVI